MVETVEDTVVGTVVGVVIGVVERILVPEKIYMHQF